MADAPNDYRDPKVTTEKKSSGSIIPWILLALGVLALLAWLLGLFGTDDDVVVAPAETTVEEPAVVTTEPVTPTVEPETPVVVETPTVEPETPVVVETPTTEPTVEAAPNATDVETTTVPITPAEPAAPATDN